jgi:hypothetical protein
MTRKACHLNYYFMIFLHILGKTTRNLSHNTGDLAEIRIYPLPNESQKHYRSSKLEKSCCLLTAIYV